MKNPFRMKSAWYCLIIAASLSVMVQSASAAVLLSDTFTVDANSNDPNFELTNGRQTGSLAPARYTGWASQHQVGNTTTDVGQPGGATNGNFVLLAFDGSFFSDLNIASVATGPLTIQFDMYLTGANNPNNDPTTWGAFTLRAAGDGWPIANAGEFGFLARVNGGVITWQNGGPISPGGWDSTGFATDTHWTFIFSDTAGTGSAFNGNGSQVAIMNGTNMLGTNTLGQLNSAGLRLGFRSLGNRFAGIDNLVISGTPAVLSPPGNNLSFEYDLQLPGNSIPFVPTSWTAFNLVNNGDFGSQNAGGVDYTVNTPLAAPAAGNQFGYVNVFNGTAVGGIYQDMGALQPNGIYTLSVAIGSRADRINSPGIISLINGTDNTGTVMATGGGLPGTQDTWQDYTATFATGPSVSGDLTILLSALGAGTIQADFDNVRLVFQPSSVPLPVLVSNTQPASATVGVGGNVVFTAAFSNSPPVSLQWQQIVSSVTNNINTGVVNVTNNGVVSSTLALNNVQLGNAGSYRLKAANATNLVTVVNSQSAPLTVIPTITWYAAGTYNYSFSNNSVLALAGTVGNEVYGVNFGVGPITTANGYSFDDYAGSGNMSVVSSGLGSFSGYLGGATTGDLNFDTILNNGVFGSSANTATLNNLTIGQVYTVLVLQDDTRTSGAGGPNFNVTDGLTVSPAQRYAFPNGVPSIGGYIMGTFTAQAATQPLTVLNNGNAQYIAVLLEKGIATPPANAPELTADIHPLLSEVTAGAPVTLSVVAAGSLPLHYQWFDQNGQINGATNPGYTFTALNGTNSYHVSITNAYGPLLSSTAVVVGSPTIVTVNNFSFEDGTTGSGFHIVPVLWTDFSNSNFSVVADNSYSVVHPLAPTAQGNDFFAINEGPSDPTGGIYQDVGALLPNTVYTLTVAIGRRADVSPGTGDWSPGIISLINGTDNTGTLLATTNGRPATLDTWQDYTVSYTTGSPVSGHLTVELSVAPAGTFQANFDNVRLTAVPLLQLGRPVISGGNLILTGVGGSPNAGYTLLSATNLSAPITWTTNNTGTFDGAGAFSNSIPIGVTPARFFRLRAP